MNSLLLFRNIVLVCFAGITSVQHLFAQLQQQVVVSIPFKTNSFIIEKRYQLNLDTLAEKCSKNENFKMKIYAFTDTTGCEGFNDTLSDERLDAVYDYLAARVPLNEKNTYSTAQGESEESYDLHFKGAHVQQRYVDIRVFFYKK